MGSRRKVFRTPRFEREWGALARKEVRADEALTGFEEITARIPDRGMPVRGQPSFVGCPVHLDEASYMVLYTYDAETVTLIAVRRIPSGPFGD